METTPAPIDYRTARRIIADHGIAYHQDNNGRMFTVLVDAGFGTHMASTIVRRLLNP